MCVCTSFFAATMKAVSALLVVASSAAALTVAKPRLVGGGSSEMITTASLVSFEWTVEDADPSHMDVKLEGATGNYTLGTNVTNQPGPGSVTTTMDKFSPE